MSEVIDEPPFWLTLKLFGYRNGGISDQHVRKLIKEGDGPRTTYIGNKVFVSIDDEREWRERMRKPHGKAAEKAVAVAKMCHERAKLGGRATWAHQK